MDSRNVPLERVKPRKNRNQIGVEFKQSGNAPVNERILRTHMVPSAKYNNYLPLDHPDRGTHVLVYTQGLDDRDYRSTSRRRCVILPSTPPVALSYINGDYIELIQ